MEKSGTPERETVSSIDFNKRQNFWGSICLLGGLLSFLGFLFSAVISKILPPFEDKFLSAIQQDRYYCLLIPLTFPVLIVAVYFHWLSMKLFKHT